MTEEIQQTCIVCGGKTEFVGCEIHVRCLSKYHDQKNEKRRSIVENLKDIECAICKDKLINQIKLIPCIFKQIVDIFGFLTLLWDHYMQIFPDLMEKEYSREELKLLAGLDEIDKLLYKLQKWFPQLCPIAGARAIQQIEQCPFGLVKHPPFTQEMFPTEWVNFYPHSKKQIKNQSLYEALVYGVGNFFLGNEQN